MFIGRKKIRNINLDDMDNILQQELQRCASDDRCRYSAVCNGFLIC